MQIVIDIPEEEYEFCKKQWDTECLDTLMIAVKYGTPLPKGHGKLKDADKIANEFSALSDNWDPCRNEYETGRCESYYHAVDVINDAQTIIEADRAESEE